jgi:putative serine protease PepD
MPLVGTAAAAALLASVGTAGLVHAFDSPGQGTAVSVASLGATAAASSSGVPVNGSTSDDPDWEAVASAVRPSVVAIDVQLQSGTAKGSGVVADAAGHVVTNNHVVAGATSDGITVTLSDGRVYQATVVGTDPTTDLAVLEVTDPPTDLVPAVFADSDGVRVGSPVMAVGNPLGLDSTVTTGIVSALDRPVSTSDGSDTAVTNAIQIDAAINPGNSGGPLFDASGKVIGITSSIASLSSGSSAGSIGLGFAIPADLVDRIAAELIATGKAEHAFLGVTLADGTATVDGTTRRGAEVRSVTAGSPAATAGLQVGDVVVAIGDHPVNGAESLTAFVREETSGGTDTLTVVRDGQASSFTVTFAALSTASTASSGQSGQGGSGRSSEPSLPFPWGQQG